MDPRARNSDRTGMDGPGFPHGSAALGVSSRTATVFFGGLCGPLRSHARPGCSDRGKEVRYRTMQLKRVGWFCKSPSLAYQTTQHRNSNEVFAGEMFITLQLAAEGEISSTAIIRFLERGQDVVATP